jgi:hypothetical protein
MKANSMLNFVQLLILQRSWLGTRAIAQLIVALPKFKSGDTRIKLP